MMKIVIGSDIQAVGLDGLRAEFPEVEFVEARTTPEQVEAVKDADAYLGRIPREAFLAAGPRLRWVHSSGAGIENILSIPELVASEVVVTNTRGGHAGTIAEHTFALLLALTRQLFPIHEDQKRRVWDRPTHSRASRGLAGQTMVILGLGNIGRAIAQRAVAFELRVIGVDLRPGAVPPGVEAVWGLERLDEALALADVVAVATPLTAETTNLLDERRVGRLKPEAYLLVVSRGGIIDEAALVAALRAGKLAGAGLDVQAREPLPADDPLWEAPNLILSPHCSGASRQTTARVWQITEDNVRRFIAGEPLMNVCDKRAGF